MKKIIIGNWKMNPSKAKEAEKLLKDISKNIKSLKKTEVVVCPPFVYLEKLNKISKKISLGAQDIFWGDVGAYTGEVSGKMLSSVGVKYVIIGHSERRALGETNLMVNKKVKSALEENLVPIVCVGENSRDEKHEYFNIIKNQIEECLAGVIKNLMMKVIIAYEPIWAISTSVNHKEATPEISREMSIFIRKVLNDKFGAEVADKVRIIYGGSASPQNAQGFLCDGGAEGLLPGRDSLDSKKFLEIIKIAESL